MPISIPKAPVLALCAMVLALSGQPAAAQPSLDPGYAVATANVHMRAGPGTDYASLDVLSAGTEVVVLGCFEARPWCEVEALGLQGFVSARYLGLIDAPVPVADYAVLAPHYYESFVYVAPSVFLVDRPRRHFRRAQSRRHIERPRQHRAEHPRVRHRVDRPSRRRHVERPRLRRDLDRPRVRHRVEQPSWGRNVERTRARRNTERAGRSRQARQSRQSGWSGQARQSRQNGSNRASGARRAGGGSSATQGRSWGR